MRVVSIVGARPQFVKLAPVSRAMADHSVTGGTAIDDIIVHTGQHYDASMSDVFFEELNIPRPDVNLEIGSGLHGAQSGRMLEAIENVLLQRKPEMVVVYGDTNSTLAGALAAAKLCIPIAHIEAGLRSFNRSMPEEVNRVVADHLSDILFAPTATAMRNLKREGLGGKASNSGDVMLDAVNYNAALAEERSKIRDTLQLAGTEYAVVTLHRASNTENDALVDILDTLNAIAAERIPIVFPAHQRTVAVLDKVGSGWRAVPQLRVIEPVGYLDMLELVGNARMVLTDSGGLQKEALFLRTPCITLRDETEWTETVDVGANVLSGRDREQILSAVDDWLARPASLQAIEVDGAPFGDGHAATAIVREILQHKAA